MPRVYKSGTTKQRHKAFKGTKKNADKSPKPIGAVMRKKKIHKAEVKKQKLTNVQKAKLKRQNIQLRDLQKKLKANNYLDSQSKSRIEDFIKKQIGIKIVVLIPFNSQADTSEIQNKIKNYIYNKTQKIQQSQIENNSFAFKYPYFHFFAHPNNFPGLVKQNFLFIEADRNIQNIADFCKVADIICPILSCKDTNVQGLALNPYNNAKAFDEDGYKLLQILKHQGMPRIVSLIQHLEFFQNKKQHQKVQKLFKRYFASEFGQQQKILNIGNKEEDIFNLLRALQNSSAVNIPWRNQRGYLLSQKIEYNQLTNQLIVSGFLKGNCVNANQLVHITGYDDYQVQKIQIIKSKSKLQRVKTHKSKQQILEQQQNLVQYSIPNDQIYPFHRISVQNQANQLMNAFQGLTLSKPILQQTQQLQMQQQIQDQQQDISFDQEDQNLINFKQQQKKNRMELHMRQQEDLQFEDEVEYPPDVSLRQKFANYQGLASFKKTQWNSLENLPDEFNQIYVFKNYQKTMKNSIQQNQQKGFAYPGFYIQIYIKKFDIKILQNSQNAKKPLIISFLFKHQRKMTMLHLKVRRNAEDPEQDRIIQSERQFQINFGFKRIYTKPIFSQLFNNCQKTKFKKRIKDFQNYYYCSFYYYNTFPPAPVSIYSIDQFGKKSNIPVLYGELNKCDPMQIILKRIILTGYPLKINKRRATVRYMFFNPKDVKYFKPVELITKLGLRGNIEQSLGTHGYMKCLFSDMIKPHDTVCLYLYERVFPKAMF